MSNAYIQLYGHRHNLSDNVLAVIADAVIGDDEALSLIIDAFRDQELLDSAMENNS